jgi:hypothetical protein
LEPKGGEPLAGEGARGSQFGRLERKTGTLHTLCRRCCYITVDFAAAALQNGFSTCKQTNQYYVENDKIH